MERRWHGAARTRATAGEARADSDVDEEKVGRRGIGPTWAGFGRKEKERKKPGWFLVFFQRKIEEREIRIRGKIK